MYVLLGALCAFCCFFQLPCSSAVYTYDTKYIDVPIDHFSYTSNVTFRLRYLVNATHWKSGYQLPIFFYTGNEGNIKMFAENTGFMWEIAPEFGALIVFAEHRYYGESLPFGNKSFSDPEHVGFLTSQQALADFALLITHLQANETKPCPVIAFGGSYGGMLSAWFRMKYPNIITGAIASSAPIWQFPGLTPCEAFYRIVTSTFNASGDECAESVRRSWKAIDNVTSTDAGKAWLSSNWTMCKPLKNDSEVDDLKGWLVNVYTNLAMINYPYATNFLMPVPANPVSVACSKLRNSSLAPEALLAAVGKALNVYTNYTGTTKCLDTASQATSDLGDLGWGFQACTEMVMPMCSDGINDMFEPNTWNFTDYSDGCYDSWKVRPQHNRAIMMYGGKDISTATNIVFSNGLLDPWSSGGVLRNVSDSTYAVIIPEGAHHLDLRASNAADPVSVREVRKFHKKCIRKWINSVS